MGEEGHCGKNLQNPSVVDGKVAELPGRSCPAQLQIVDPRQLGTSPAPVDHRLDGAFFPLENRFDPAVGTIPAPAVDAMGDGRLLRIVAEADPLYATTDQDLCANL